MRILQQMRAITLRYCIKRFKFIVKAATTSLKTKPRL